MLLNRPFKEVTRPESNTALGLNESGTHAIVLVLLVVITFEGDCCLKGAKLWWIVILFYHGSSLFPTWNKHATLSIENE